VEARAGARRRLLLHVRRRLERRFVDRLISPADLERLLESLTEQAMLVGFARRFAAYKRADLLLRDPDRLASILSRDDRPVRVFFAGKAHPDDRQGKAILKRVAEAARSGPLAGRVFLLEDYGVGLARALVQGCDLWVNNPLRSLEASGTSGMKVAANGGLNLSVADGWWPEAADGKNGWTLNPDAVGGTASEADGDASALYALLESEVIPAFFERDEHGVPRRWLDRAIHSLSTIPAVFNSDRMLREYRDWAYAPRPVPASAAKI
jgi:starch phosphorylase